MHKASTLAILGLTKPCSLYLTSKWIDTALPVASPNENLAFKIKALNLHNILDGVTVQMDTSNR